MKNTDEASGNNVRLSVFVKGSEQKGYTTDLAFEDSFVSNSDTLVSAEVMKNWVEEQNRLLRMHTNKKFPRFEVITSDDS
ncbi:MULTISPECIES: hypothetical protein [Vibrio]|uniref:hypothetical protein n=1 Tax=Vibrio TaxID=662 RepID=UPI0029642752|nr:hypothetical protein [Vibrio sp. Vb0349]MDW1916340.1 hypothetical protein [Vibrio sp. Vb0349]